MVKEPVGSFPHDNRRKTPPPSNSTAWQCGHSCVSPRRKGWECGILCTGRVCQPRSAIRLASASLMASTLARRRVSPSSRDSLARVWLATESLLLPETPWLEPPSWRRRWLAAESLSLLEIQELVVSGRYLIVSHKFFACLSESLGVESACHQQSLRVQFLQSYSNQTILT